MYNMAMVLQYVSGFFCPSIAEKIRPDPNKMDISAKLIREIQRNIKVFDAFLLLRKLTEKFGFSSKSKIFG